MKAKIINQTIGALAIIALLAPTATFAQSATGTTNRSATSTAKAATKLDKEIDQRIDKLNELITRIQQFRNIADSQKASIVATIQGLISNLNNLRAELNSTSSSTVIAANNEALKQNYRIYALAMPQLSIVAAADRIMTIAAMLDVVGAKLDARLAQATSTPAAVTTAMTDFKAKVAEAKTEAQAAFNGVSNLLPDGGDKAKMQSNLTALKDARTKIQNAKKALQAARKSADTVIKQLAKMDKDMLSSAMRGNVSTSTATSTR